MSIFPTKILLATEGSAEVEEEHARFWEEKLRAARESVPLQGRLAFQNAGHAR